MSRRPVAVLAALVSALAIAGSCSSHARDTTDPATLRVAWQQVTLTMPAGPPGRVAVRGATSCDGSWYIVGAVLGEDGASRPAAWQSTDSQTWRPMNLAPRSYYARRAILSSVACRDGRVAAVGARSGGAHGNPRVTSWYQRSDGALVDMPASFDLYGGANAVSVRRVAAGPSGWLIAGNRTSGAAVWVSADATDFRLIDDDPALSSDAGHRTVALDQVHDGTGWTLVGRAEVPDRVGPVPLAWTSADGSTWARQQVPVGTDGFADLERVVQDDDGLLAVGIRGHRFGTWRRTDGRWAATEPFGWLATDGTSAPFVSGLAIAAGKAVATVADGAAFRLWAETGEHDWCPVVTPTRPTDSGDDQLTVVASGNDVLLLADDGTSGRVWVADWNTLGR